MSICKRPSKKALSYASSTALVITAAMLAACNSSSSDPATPTTSVKGVVAGSGYVPGSATLPTINPAYYKGALVCADSNGNGKCDASENAVTTDANGKFTLSVATSAVGSIIADIPKTATNTGSSATVSTRTVFRINSAQVAEQVSGTVVLSPMSTEVQRLIEANGSSYAVEKQNLADRVGVDLDEVLADPATLDDVAKPAVLTESNALTNRFAYAITKLDRGDLYPDALAVAGGNPELVGLSGVTAATNTGTADSRKAITFLQAEQAAFNVEGIPRYDAIFIVMLENKATSSIVGSAYAPKINGYLSAGNQLTSYYATGNPSEPNYTALGGADDFGITDDSQWNCGATGANAPTDTLPVNTVAGLASSPFTSPCSSTVNHNIIGRPNLFNALTSAGLQWRTYSESMNPGQDFRTDSVADANVLAQDHVYQPNTMGGNAAVVGNSQLVLPMPAGLYKTKHHPGMAYQNVRSAPEFSYSNRTAGGGQWDGALRNGTAYAVPANYDIDQLGTDLVSGNVGQINFIMPDQCDDMHGISVKGTVTGGTTAGTASDCSSVANNVSTSAVSPIITRGDNYVDYLVKKIEASPLWKNPQKHVAIVLMFDEGSATSGFNSCCGWNAGKVSTNAPLIQSSGAWVQDSSVANYGNGNRGHGESIFGILTNAGPKKVQDSDAYSHFSFVRTLQDMFQLADPAVDSSYMNRSKYTEKFIAQNITNLPEFAASADTHFDSVRPINHAYKIPATYTQKQSADVNTTAQVGADANQTNVWASK